MPIEFNYEVADVVDLLRYLMSQHPAPVDILRNILHCCRILRLLPRLQYLNLHVHQHHRVSVSLLCFGLLFFFFDRCMCVYLACLLACFRFTLLFLRTQRQ